MTSLPRLGPRGEGWFAAQVALGGLFVQLTQRPAAWHGPARVATSTAGLALLLAGAVLGFRGARDLGRSISPFPRPRGGARLVESGIYARVRHPIYGGQLFMTLGWALLSASRAALAFVPVGALFLDLKSRREEAFLSERFPGYEAYRARTRRLIPGLW